MATSLNTLHRTSCQCRTCAGANFTALGQLFLNVPTRAFTNASRDLSNSPAFLAMKARMDHYLRTGKDDITK